MPALPSSEGSSALVKGRLPGYGTALTLRSLAEQYSQPSLMLSVSVSSRHGSVPIWSSRAFDSRSLSWSPSSWHTLAGLGPSPSPAPVTTGDSRRVVNLENLPARTRSLRRVGRCLLFLTVSRPATAAGTTTRSLVVLARRGLAKAERPLAARKMTVLPERLLLKRLPVIVSVATDADAHRLDAGDLRRVGGRRGRSSDEHDRGRDQEQADGNDSAHI